MRRLINIFVIILLLFTTMKYPKASAIKISDVKENDPNALNITYSINNKFLELNKTGSFQPNKFITTIECSVSIINILKYKKSSLLNDYNTNLNSIEFLTKLHIVPESFNDQTKTFVTKSEMSYIITNLMKLSGKFDSTISDIDSKSLYFNEINSVLANGFDTLDKNDRFFPNEKLTRKDLAKYLRLMTDPLYRTLDNIESIDLKWLQAVLKEDKNGLMTIPVRNKNIIRIQFPYELNRETITNETVYLANEYYYDGGGEDRLNTDVKILDDNKTLEIISENFEYENTYVLYIKNSIKYKNPSNKFSSIRSYIQTYDINSKIKDVNFANFTQKDVYHKVRPYFEIDVDGTFTPHLYLSLMYNPWIVKNNQITFDKRYNGAVYYANNTQITIRDINGKLISSKNIGVEPNMGPGGYGSGGRFSSDGVDDLTNDVKKLKDGKYYISTNFNIASINNVTTLPNQFQLDILLTKKDGTLSSTSLINKSNLDDDLSISDKINFDVLLHDQKVYFRYSNNKNDTYKLIESNLNKNFNTNLYNLLTSFTMEKGFTYVNKYTKNELRIFHGWSSYQIYNMNKQDLSIYIPLDKKAEEKYRFKLNIYSTFFDIKDNEITNKNKLSEALNAWFGTEKGTKLYSHIYNNYLEYRKDINNDKLKPRQSIKKKTTVNNIKLEFNETVDEFSVIFR